MFCSRTEMGSTAGSGKLHQNWPHALSSKGARPYQLGMTSALSPSMMSSNGPPH
ncbi:MAG: hypothetical protein LQ341_005033, partial [Variospora aurantia]